MTNPHQSPRSWEEVATLQMLAEQGDEDAEFWVDNPVCWAFPWEHSIDLSEWETVPF